MMMTELIYEPDAYYTYEPEFEAKFVRIITDKNYALKYCIKKNIKEFENTNKADWIDLPSILNEAPYALQNSPNIVLHYVKNGYYNLQYASEDLQDNFELAMECMKINGRCLRFVSERLRDNFEIVMASIESGKTYLYCISDRLLDNFELSKQQSIWMEII
jgi:hypothetical protein